MISGICQRPKEKTFVCVAYESECVHNLRASTAAPLKETSAKKACSGTVACANGPRVGNVFHVVSGQR